MKLSLLTEGSSDVALLRPLRWLLNDLDPALDYTLNWVDFRHLRSPPKSPETRVRRAMEVADPDVLLLHRDADGRDPMPRRKEITVTFETAEVAVPAVAVVPVTMMEAWFLFDEAAIRMAAGNPEGRMKLTVPEPHKLLKKQELFSVLRQASGRSGRRLKDFRPEEAFHALAEGIDDFAPLDGLAAFRMLREDLGRALAKVKGDRT